MSRRSNRVAASLVAATLILAAAPGRSDEALSYGGIRRDTDFLGLVARYPQSVHELWLASGDIVSSSAGATAALREQIAHGTGQYLIRLAPGESHDRLHFVSVRLSGGVPGAVRLSFELPSQLLRGSFRSPQAEFEARHPTCQPLRTALAGRYGTPRALDPTQEERLETRRWTWTRGTETLTLACGQYQGRKKAFATDVLLERAPQ
jgi:hypothetical protein